MGIVPAHVGLDEVGDLVAEWKPANPSFVAEESLHAHDFAVSLDGTFASYPFAGSLFAEHPAGTVGELILDELSLARWKRARLLGHMTLAHDLELRVAQAA